MNFKYSCFTENTQDNREWLEKLGYKFIYGINNQKFLNSYTNSNDEGVAIGWDLIMMPKYAIDCRSNPSLFKAVSAVREDSDKHQWFTNGKDWCKCYFDKFSHFAFHQQVESSIDLIVNWHKATLEELIEKFK